MSFVLAQLSIARRRTECYAVVNLLYYASLRSRTHPWSYAKVTPSSKNSGSDTYVPVGVLAQDM